MESMGPALRLSLAAGFLLCNLGETKWSSTIFRGIDRRISGQELGAEMPGSTTVTLTPSSANSFAKLSEMPSTANLIPQ